MRIAIDLTALTDRLSGLERCAYELTAQMIRVSSKDHFLLLVKDTPSRSVRKLGRYPNVSFVRLRSLLHSCGSQSDNTYVGRSGLLRQMDKLLTGQLALTAAISRCEADVIFFPVFPMPLLLPLVMKGRMPAVYVLIADTACFDVPETMGRFQRLFWKTGFLREARLAKGIITVSGFSAERIVENLNISREKITVAYNGVKLGEHTSFGGTKYKAHAGESIVSCDEGAEVLKKYGITRPYYLTLSTLEPRKNINLLLHAYHTLREAGEDLPTLVVAGRSGWSDKSTCCHGNCGKEGDFSDRCKCGRVKCCEEHNENDYREGIVFTGFIDEQDLPAIYANADAFIFPSFYEGFGLPPLEAQLCGVRRVLVSDAPALKEVLGDTANYFQRRDAASLADALVKLRDEENIVSEEKIRDNLSRFSWEESASSVLFVLRSGAGTKQRQ